MSLEPWYLPKGIPMTTPPEPLSAREVVFPTLLQIAIPDARLHDRYEDFVPDFRGSSSALERIIDLEQYKSAKTILVTPDNSLDAFRNHALQDGKRLLVATHNLKRGYVFLNPDRIDRSSVGFAGYLDVMERPGFGRHLTLAEIQDEGVCVDLWITGFMAVTTRGLTVWESQNLICWQWLMLM